MTLGFYRAIRGAVWIKAGTSPDGDSIRFIPDGGLTHLRDLHNFKPPDGGNLNPVNFQLRLQAIDAPELHYQSKDQPFGIDARNGFFQWLGLNPATVNWTVAPAGFDFKTNATILTDGFEGHGRPISFLMMGQNGPETGAEIKPNFRSFESSLVVDQRLSRHPPI